MENNEQMNAAVAARMLLVALTYRIHGNDAMAEDIEERVHDRQSAVMMGRHFLQVAIRLSQAGRSDEQVTDMLEKADLLMTLHPTGNVEVLIARSMTLQNVGNLVDATQAAQAAGQLIDRLNEAHQLVEPDVMERYQLQLEWCLRTLVKSGNTAVIYETVRGLARL